MRKFRVWDKKKKRWVKKDDTRLVWPVLTTDGNIIVLEFSTCDDTAEVIDEGDTSRFEVNFHTGIKDKNGREIYEGDIVRVHAPEGQKIGVVKYEEGCFVVEYEDEQATPLCWLEDPIEIVGNVYESWKED